MVREFFPVAMADPAIPAPKTPWHLWAVGVLAVLWNAVGVLDFTMTETRNAAYMSAFTPTQLEFFYSLPVWVVVAWGIAVWGGLAGSLLLLCRKKLAGPIFLASLVGIVLTTLHNYVLANGLEVQGGGAGAVVFSAVIFVTGALLWGYARSMRRQGVLR
jgi:hypothetical protein